MDSEFGCGDWFSVDEWTDESSGSVVTERSTKGTTVSDNSKKPRISASTAQVNSKSSEGKNTDVKIKVPVSSEKRKVSQTSVRDDKNSNHVSESSNAVKKSVPGVENANVSVKKSGEEVTSSARAKKPAVVAATAKPSQSRQDSPKETGKKPVGDAVSITREAKNVTPASTGKSVQKTKCVKPAGNLDRGTREASISDKKIKGETRDAERDSKKSVGDIESSAKEKRVVNVDSTSVVGGSVPAAGVIKKAHQVDIHDLHEECCCGIDLNDSMLKNIRIAINNPHYDPNGDFAEVKVSDAIQIVRRADEGVRPIFEKEELLKVIGRSKCSLHQSRRIVTMFTAPSSVSSPIENKKECKKQESSGSSSDSAARKSVSIAESKPKNEKREVTKAAVSKSKPSSESSKVQSKTLENANAAEDIEIVKVVNAKLKHTKKECPHRAESKDKTVNSKKDSRSESSPRTKDPVNTRKHNDADGRRSSEKLKTDQVNYAREDHGTKNDARHENRREYKPVNNTRVRSTRLADDMKTHQRMRSPDRKRSGSPFQQRREGNNFLYRSRSPPAEVRRNSPSFRKQKRSLSPRGIWKPQEEVTYRPVNNPPLHNVGPPVNRNPPQNFQPNNQWQFLGNPPPQQQQHWNSPNMNWQQQPPPPQPPQHHQPPPQQFNPNPQLLNDMQIQPSQPVGNVWQQNNVNQMGNFQNPHFNQKLGNSNSNNNNNNNNNSSNQWQSNVNKQKKGRNHDNLLTLTNRKRSSKMPSPVEIKSNAIPEKKYQVCEVVDYGHSSLQQTGGPNSSQNMDQDLRQPANNRNYQLNSGPPWGHQQRNNSDNIDRPVSPLRPPPSFGNVANSLFSRNNGQNEVIDRSIWGYQGFAPPKMNQKIITQRYLRGMSPVSP